MKKSPKRRFVPFASLLRSAFILPLSKMSGSPVTSEGVSLEERTKQHESEFSKEFRGPVADSDRSCTDFVWSILFGLFWVGMLAIGVVAMQEAASIGGYTRVVNGYQADGKICGQSGDYGAGTEYKYLYTYPSMEQFQQKFHSHHQYTYQRVNMLLL